MLPNGIKMLHWRDKYGASLAKKSAKAQFSVLFLWSWCFMKKWFDPSCLASLDCEKCRYQSTTKKDWNPLFFYSYFPIKNVDFFALETINETAGTKVSLWGIFATFIFNYTNNLALGEGLGGMWWLFCLFDRTGTIV